MQNSQLTSTEAADELGVSEATVRRYIHSGALRATKRGSMWFVDACSLENLVGEEFDNLEEEELDESECECDHDDEDDEDEDEDED